MDDNDDGSYSEVATGVTSTSHTESGLTTGEKHKFKVRARNAVDFSSYSLAYTIYPAIVPSQPSTPSTALNGGETLVIIDWSEPSDTGGIDISGYKVEIKTSSNTYE